MKTQSVKVLPIQPIRPKAHVWRDATTVRVDEGSAGVQVREVMPPVSHKILRELFKR